MWSVDEVKGDWIWLVGYGMGISAGRYLVADDIFFASTSCLIVQHVTLDLARYRRISARIQSLRKADKI